MHLKTILTNYFSSPEQREILKKNNEEAFQAQLKLEASSDGSFRDELRVLWQMCSINKDSPYYSVSNFLDCAVMIVTFACGIFTLSLLI